MPDSPQCLWPAGEGPCDATVPHVRMVPLDPSGPGIAKGRVEEL